MADRIPELERARQLLGNIDPPLGARARVRSRVQQSVSRSWWRSTSAPAITAAAIVCCGGVALAVTGRSRPAHHDALGTGSHPRPLPRSQTKPPLERGQPEAAHSAPSPNRANDVAPPPSTSPPSPGRAPASSTRDSSLALQVAAYRAALATAGRNDRQAVAALRRFKRQWPASPLNHEADLEIIAALVRLGEHGRARQASREFVAAHPSSPRAPEVRRIAEGQP